MNGSIILGSYLLSPLSKNVNPDHSSLFKLVKDPDSNRVNDLLINKTIPDNLYNNFLPFLDTNKNFESNGGLLKMMTKKN